MAQADRATRADVDHLLNWAVSGWEGLTEIECEIDSWDLIDQIVFIEEWPLEEERVRRLASLAQMGAFTDSQRARYEALLMLVARQRPIINRLRNA